MKIWTFLRQNVYLFCKIKHSPQSRTYTKKHLTLEFRKGVIQTFDSINNNAIQTNNIPIYFIVTLLFNNFTRIANLYFLFISFLMLFSKHSPFLNWIVIIPLSLHAIFYCLKEIYIIYKQN